MRAIIGLVIPAVMLSLPLLSNAGKPPRPPPPEWDAGPVAIGHTADASFMTLVGCDDIVVGVTVREGVVDLNNPTAVETIDVFGTASNICDMGGSGWSFAGSVALRPGDFSQSGVDSAKLDKTFSVQGHNLRLKLNWTGTGAATGSTGTTSRAASVTGDYVLDGLNQISGNTQAAASLTITQMAAP